MNSFDGQGFHLTATKREPVTLALISLKTALQNYFETHRSVHQVWSWLGSTDPSDRTVLEFFYRGHSGGMPYIENYVESIIHFHHFAELTCVELLRTEHFLLATEQCKENENHKEVYKRIRVLPNNPSRGNTIGFDKAIKRLHTLVNDKNTTTLTRLNNSDLSFIDDTTKKNLLQLLELRNLLLHQGTFILEYDYLDQFIGNKLLPFIIKMVELPEFSNYNRIWQHSKIACKKTNGDDINPISDIAVLCQTTYDRGHIAFLKELGRSAYRNFISQHEPPTHGFGSAMISRGNPVRIAAQKRVNEALQEEEVYEIQDCLTCGEETLVMYEDGAQCTNCSFSIDYRFKNPFQYGVNYRDFWISV